MEDLEGGCYEQRAQDWEEALQAAMATIHQAVPTLRVLAIGIAGQMHGEVLVDESGTVVAPVRLWCDARNAPEEEELTEVWHCKVPKRATSARFLWTIRNRPDTALRVRHLTTPAGWISYRLTGEWNLGIGDASGMFPIDPNSLDYERDRLQQYDQLVAEAVGSSSLAIPPVASLLPTVRRAGETAGRLTQDGAMLLGGHVPAGVLVAPAEGDQVAALAASGIARPGIVSCSFGTSVCANSVADDRPFVGVSPSIDHFCAADGRPIHMVWLRNGTTFLNAMVDSYGTFHSIMPQLLQAPPDCQGLLALPFMDDEPGLQVSDGRCALIVGFKSDNATAGNVAKAALLSTMFNLKMGCAVLDRQNYPRHEIVLSGGLTKTPNCGQILADVFDVPVTLSDAAEEGCSWGATVLAKFCHEKEECRNDLDWTAFLEELATGRAAKASHGSGQRFEPHPDAVEEYKRVFQRYRALMELHPQLSQALADR